MAENDKPTLKERLTSWMDIARMRASRAREATATNLNRWGVGKGLTKGFTQGIDPAGAASGFVRWLRTPGARRVGKALTIIACMWFLADVIALLVDRYVIDRFVGTASSGAVGGAPRLSRRLDPRDRPLTEADYAAIQTRNLFNEPEACNPAVDPTCPCPPENPYCRGDGPARPTTLPFNLVGTVILRDELRSLATIEDRTAQTVYPVRAKDEIPGKARILSVTSRRVEFINTTNNQKEFVELPQENIQMPALSVRSSGGKPSLNPGVEKVSETQYNLSRDAVDNTLRDLNQVLTQARCVPNFENGMPAGFKCFQIVKGSIYDQLGLKDNDVICGINGSPINDLGKAFEQLNEIKTASHVEICIKRDGRQQNFAYDIH